MKVSTSFLKRCAALVLALVLLVSSSNLGVVLTVRAGTVAETVTAGELVANNYELSDAEEALLSSGFLAGSSYSYTVPDSSDNLVTVDTEAKAIDAQNYENWVPTVAKIMVGLKEEETVILTNGEGFYTYAGNAFSVEVQYILHQNVDTALQETLLNTAGWLKNGIANVDALVAQVGALSALELAMPELVNLADNGYEVFGKTTNIKPEVKSAIYTLNGQMTANGGSLNLVVMQNAYAAGKTGYLLQNGIALKHELVSDRENINWIYKLLGDIQSMSELVGTENIDQNTLKLIDTLHSILGNWVAAADTAIAGDWTAAEKGTALVADSVNYATLDTLVAALGSVTPVTVKESLLVAETTVRTNLAMYNVNVKVVLNVVKDNAVVEHENKSVTLVLAKGAAPAEILTAVEDNGIVASALAAWDGIYVAEHFERSETKLPSDGLFADLDYTITYTPKDYTVTIADESAQYPYGYKLTLPVHADASRSYDYFDAESNYYAQGTVITVTGDLTLTRTEGKAYTPGKLLNIIAENYASDKAAAILNSGALLVDEPVNYREPSKDQLEELVKLAGNTLTVQTYPSSYAGLSWAPYSYVVDGTEKLFNGADEITIDGDFETVSVYYRLTLTNYSAAEVKEILDLVVTLVDEAEGQKSVMDKLVGYEGQMSQLTKNMLTGLTAVIGNYTTANGGGLHDDPATNDALVAYFQEIITKIANECTNGQPLKLYNIIQEYKDPNNGGLAYYYVNDIAIRNEVAVLSGYLNDMLDGGNRQTALEKLMADNGYEDKVDVLETLGTKLAEISAELKPVNAAIDTTNAASLRAMAELLSSEGSVAYTEYGSPYIQMGPVIRTADKYVTVEVKAVAGGKSTTASVTILKGTALTQAQVNTLKGEIETFVTATIDASYYTNDYNNGAALDALVGNVLNEGTDYTYTWTAKTYTVKIEGEADQTITVDGLTVTLPAHPQAANGMSYEYTIGGTTAKSGTYTFDKADLDTLFVNGVYTITRVEKNAAVEQLVKMVNTINTNMGFEALTLVQQSGVYTGIVANIGMNNMMDFVMGLVLDSGYGYIGLNNEGLVYSGSEGLEISIQTLINAILNDEEFANSTVIALGENGKGKLFSASMQLGNSASELSYSNLSFTMNLNSVPPQLITNVDLVKLASNYIKFQSDEGILNASVNLPDKAYGAYAAALIATGTVEKTNVNELTQKVAIQFVYDYLTAITGSEADMDSFTNTLKILGLNKNLSGYNSYYNPAVAAFNQHVTVEISDDGAAIDISAPGQKSIDALMKLAGMNTEGMSAYLSMIKEYKAGGTIEASIDGTLKNTDKTYYALIVDAQANGVTNKFEAPSSVAALQEQTSTLAGYSAIILLDDVKGDLTINGTTVLDLNGKNVEGEINATGTLYIIDSTMDTYNAGTVGSVSGNAVIIGGNYNADVSSYLKDGYYMDGTTVRNALYYIADKDGTVTFHLNGDVYEDEHVSGYFPNPKALAIDIAADLVLNYAYSAMLSVEGNELIGIDVDDLLGIYDDRDAAGLVKTLINCVTVGEAGYENNVGFEAVVNLILDDVIDFNAISAALTNGTALASYAITTEPWTIELEHIADGDYVTVNVGSNADLAKNFNVALVVESKYNDALIALAGELANIVEDRTDLEIDIPAPTYSDKTITVTGAGKAEVYVDMSQNSNYATMIGVILAYGNSAKREAVADAINTGSMAGLKAVVDEASVAELFTALKAMGRNVDFAAMAEAVGVTIDVSSAATLEGVYHKVLCASGKVLEELEITGKSSKLGNLYNTESGYYELTRENMFKDGELSARGYTARVELTADVLSLQVKLFGAIEEPVDCLWGDANHDNLVNAQDATLVLQYSVYEGDLSKVEGDIFCTERTDVNDDGLINAQDATLILQRAVNPNFKFPAEG